jgi:hypothetical protein
MNTGNYLHFSFLKQVSLTHLVWHREISFALVMFSRGTFSRRFASVSVRFGEERKNSMMAVMVTWHSMMGGNWKQINNIVKFLKKFQIFLCLCF